MKKSNSKTELEDWMNKKWRPLMGYCYMLTCLMDFIIFPILWTVVQFWETQSVNDAFRQWQPLTLQGAGLFHMAMGAVIGLAAWGRTQEKINGVANSPSTSIAMNPQTDMSYQAPSMSLAPAMSPAPAMSQSMSSPSMSYPSPVTMNSKGKKVVPLDDDPEI